MNQKRKPVQLTRDIDVILVIVPHDLPRPVLDSEPAIADLPAGRRQRGVVAAERLAEIGHVGRGAHGVDPELERARVYEHVHDLSPTVLARADRHCFPTSRQLRLPHSCAA